MSGKKISEKTVSIPEVKKLMEVVKEKMIEIDSEEGMTHFQEITYNYVNKFSKMSEKDAKKIQKFLTDKHDLEEVLPYRIKTVHQPDDIVIVVESRPLSGLKQLTGIARIIIQKIERILGQYKILVGVYCNRIIDDSIQSGFIADKPAFQRDVFTGYIFQLDPFGVQRHRRVGIGQEFGQSERRVSLSRGEKIPTVVAVAIVIVQGCAEMDIAPGQDVRFVDNGRETNL